MGGVNRFSGGVPRLGRIEIPPKEGKGIVRNETDLEDINKPLEDTNDANPNGAIVRCTEDGIGVYNDRSHQIVVNPEDGRITVLDRDTSSGESLKMNFTIKDGWLTYHNPRYKEGGDQPEFLHQPIPPRGKEMVLDGDTTLFLNPKPDGTMDVKIVNVDPLATDKEELSGIKASFNGVGSGKPFKAGANAECAPTGGKEYIQDWEKAPGHDLGGTSEIDDKDHNQARHGSMQKVWVASMFSPVPQGAYEKHQEPGDQDFADTRMPAGGISQRSNGKGDGDYGGVIWICAWDDDFANDYDGGYYWSDAAGFTADGLKKIAETGWSIPKSVNYDYSNLTDQQKQAALKAIADSEAFLPQGDDGVPLFSNPNAPEDPNAPPPIYGEGKVAGSDGEDTSTDEDTDEDSGEKPEPTTSRRMTFSSFLATAAFDYESAAERAKRLGEKEA